MESRRIETSAHHHLDLVTLTKISYRVCISCSAAGSVRRRPKRRQDRQLPDASRARLVLDHFDRRIDGLGIDSMPSVKNMRRAISRGVAYHHAGLLPVLKEIVEDLFERKLIRVLYATETFAVGINFPVKSVCFDTVRKFNGVDFRPMTGQEYFQMAGRAGRRGIDEEGFVYILANLNYFRPDEYPSTDERTVEPLVSRFALSYNTVVNLIATRSHDEIQKVLKQNFASYQQSAERQHIEKELAAARELEAEIVGSACDKLKGGRPPDLLGALVSQISEIKLQLKRLAKHRRSLRQEGRPAHPA